MRIVSRVDSIDGKCTINLATNDIEHALAVDAKSDERGVRTNGGEFLCTALATCFCNDLYREAVPRGIDVVSVAVEVAATFGGPGEPARSIEYKVVIAARAVERDIEELARHTDSVAEIQNTLRQGMPVRLTGIIAETR